MRLLFCSLLLLIPLSCGTADAVWDTLNSPEYQAHAERSVEVQESVAVSLGRSSEIAGEAVGIVEAVVADGRVESAEATMALSELIPLIEEQAALTEATAAEIEAFIGETEAEVERVRARDREDGEEDLPEWLLWLLVGGSFFTGAGMKRFGPAGPIFDALGDLSNGYREARAKRVLEP